MAKFLAMQVRMGKLYAEYVPEKYRDAVYAILDKDV